VAAAVLGVPHTRFIIYYTVHKRTAAASYTLHLKTLRTLYIYIYMCVCVCVYACSAYEMRLWLFDFLNGVCIFFSPPVVVPVRALSISIPLPFSLSLSLSAAVFLCEPLAFRKRKRTPAPSIQYYIYL
jgi:hypothetical protein